MEILIATVICILTLPVESQYQQYNEQHTEWSRIDYATPKAQSLYLNVDNTASNTGPAQNLQIGSNTQRLKVIERDSYLDAISRSQNSAPQQYPDLNIKGDAGDDGIIHFQEPNVQLSPPRLDENTNTNYYSIQQNNNVAPNHIPDQKNAENIQQTTVELDQSILNNVTISVSNFGLRVMKIASELQSGNVIVSPTSIAIVLALLQQGATGTTLKQITGTLQMTSDASNSAFSIITANMRKRNSRNILAIANSIFVDDSFELNNAFKTLAIRSFWSEVSPTNFNNPTEAIEIINSWVAAKTHNKIENLLLPGSLSAATQLALVNAVYFKGLWETKFKPESTKNGTFHLNNGVTKNVPFMRIRQGFLTGYDDNTRALVTILPFEGHQYSLILILPKKTDNVANVLSTLTAEQLLRYHRFNKVEIAIEIPKFTLKTDTDLNPVLQNMGLTNIFGSNSDLSGIGLYRNSSPQISRAVHSGFLSIDEQGVTAAAATAFVAVALSYDDPSVTFKADRPFLAVLWDNQYSIPLFMAKIEDPS